MVNPLNVEGANPFEIAQEAAAQIARISGIQNHDIALTLGSGWAKAADLIGETVSEIPGNEIIGLRRLSYTSNFCNIFNMVSKSFG